LLHENIKKLHLQKVFMKRRILDYLNANTTSGATPVNLTTAQIAAALNATKEVVWMILLQLQSEQYIIQVPSTTAKKIDASWRTVKTVVLP
jgi:phenylpyruvate tautomerase PptA (4-oxalocrotonate tautomerase family)